ncbi:hypothetical protein DC522_03160 [Microvirga sp. KLBC 81]|nr:hypothetical protein DC522_03160 [Microvirga sp. KLBC 81]
MRIESTGREIAEELKPKATSIRRRISEECLIDGLTVREVSRWAKGIGGTSVRRGADLLIALLVGHVRLSKQHHDYISGLKQRRAADSAESKCRG